MESKTKTTKATTTKVRATTSIKSATVKQEQLSMFEDRIYQSMAELNRLYDQKFSDAMHLVNEDITSLIRENRKTNEATNELAEEICTLTKRVKALSISNICLAAGLVLTIIASLM